jgi:hypothetical protein
MDDNDLIALITIFGVFFVGTLCGFIAALILIKINLGV